MPVQFWLSNIHFFAIYRRSFVMSFHARRFTRSRVSASVSIYLPLQSCWHVAQCSVCEAATTGSSEAAQLRGLAMKKKLWQERRKALAGKSTHEPGYYFSDRFIASVDLSSRFRIERSLGTYAGHYEPVKAMSDLLDEYQAKTGNFVPIHGWFSWYTMVMLLFLTFHIVDVASGGFVTPFVTVRLIYAGFTAWAYCRLQWSWRRSHFGNLPSSKFRLNFLHNQ